LTSREGLLGAGRNRAALLRRPMPSDIILASVLIAHQRGLQLWHGSGWDSRSTARSRRVGVVYLRLWPNRKILWRRKRGGGNDPHRKNALWHVATSILGLTDSTHSRSPQPQGKGLAHNPNGKWLVAIGEVRPWVGRTHITQRYYSTVKRNLKA